MNQFKTGDIVRTYANPDARLFVCNAYEGYVDLVFFNDSINEIQYIIREPEESFLFVKEAKRQSPRT